MVTAQSTKPVNPRTATTEAITIWDIIFLISGPNNEVLCMKISNCYTCEFAGVFGDLSDGVNFTARQNVHYVDTFRVSWQPWRSVEWVIISGRISAADW
jgi:hypothetical protein